VKFPDEHGISLRIVHPLSFNVCLAAAISAPTCVYMMSVPLEAACALGAKGIAFSNNRADNPRMVRPSLFNESAFNISATPLGLCVCRLATNSAAMGTNSQKALYATSVTDWWHAGSLVGMPILIAGETWHFKSPLWIFDLRVLHLKGF
jgi:hypothetical protein